MNISYKSGGAIVDIRQLSYFMEVARQMSFSKAAQKLNLTQPTLSKMVKNLEDELQVTLFERTTKHVQLTDAGIIVLGEAKEIMRLIENMSSKLSDMMEIKQGRIKIGLPPVIGSLFFPKLLSDFHAMYPQIHIQLYEEGAKRVEKLVDDGSVDFGFAVLPVDENSFDTFPFVKRELKLIVYPEHKFAREQQVTLGDLRNETFISFIEDFALHDSIREHCIRAGFEPTVAYESSQWDFISEMVANKQGVSILPEPLCQKLDLDRIKTVSIADPSIPWNLALIWRKNKYLSYATRELITFIRTNFQDEGKL